MIRPLEIKSATKGDAHYFLNYYSCERWSPNNKSVVLIKVPNEDRKIGYVGYLALDGDCKTLAETTVWNWQIGACQTWVDDDHVIFNSMNKDGSLCAKIVDIKTCKPEYTLDFPFFYYSYKLRLGVSFNFLRVYRMRPGYGYNNSQCFPFDDAKDGLYVFNLDHEHPRAELVWSFTQMSSILYKLGIDIKNNPKWIDIAVPNGLGNLIAFILRVGTKRGRRSFLMVVSTDGTCGWLVSPPGYNVSHFCWLDSQTIVAWLEMEIVNPYFKRFVRGVCLRQNWIGRLAVRMKLRGFFTLSKSGDVFQSMPFLYVDDAHVSKNPVNNLLSLDTYPDNNNTRYIFIYSLKTRRLESQTGFYSPPSMIGDRRCDLHASWSGDGRFLCFQSAHCGKRSVYIAEVGD